MDIAGAIIGGLSNLASTWIGSRTARRNTQSTNRANRQLAEYAYSKDLEMWQRQNEYNSPSAQMQRFKDAGLNPHLIYGQGSSGNATQLPQYSAPRQEYNYKPAIDPFSAVQGYLDLSQKSANVDLTKGQVQTEAMKYWLMMGQRAKVFADTRVVELEEQFLKNTLADRSEYANAKLVYQHAENAIRKKQAEWAKQGMNPADATWLRMTVELLKMFNVDEKRIESIMKSIPNFN